MTKKEDNCWLKPTNDIRFLKFNYNVDGILEFDYNDNYSKYVEDNNQFGKSSLDIHDEFWESKHKRYGVEKVPLLRTMELRVKRLLSLYQLNVLFLSLMSLSQKLLILLSHFQTYASVLFPITLQKSILLLQLMIHMTNF